VVTEQRNEILERLNALDPGSNEENRRAAREARIKQAVEIEDALKWGRFSAGSAWGAVGRLADYR
jgi:hypothetical protein